MINNYIIPAMECVGTVAFAISGSLVAINCGLDLFGVMTVGCITAVVIVVVIRVLAATFRWRLPKIKLEDE